MMKTIMTVEGSLDILWRNAADPRVTPRYALIFSRYDQAFRNGAQQPNDIAGAGTLENYLVKIGFVPEDAAEWIKRAHEKITVSIPNVMMPGKHLADYGL